MRKVIFGVANSLDNFIARKDHSVDWVKNYVFSHTMKASPDVPVEIIAEDAARFIRTLKHQPGRDICVMGGGELARSLFEARVIDEVGVNIHQSDRRSADIVFYLW